MEDYSDLYDDPIETLGTTGYCDLAAEVLLELFPEAQVHRFTDGASFGHVFLIFRGRALDITGFKTVEEMSATDAWQGLTAEPVSIDAVRNYFRNQGRSSKERQIVKSRFAEHVTKHPEIFRVEACLAQSE